MSWNSSMLVHSVLNHSHQRRLRHKSRKLPGSRIPGRQAWRFPAVYRCTPPPCSALPRHARLRAGRSNHTTGPILPSGAGGRASQLRAQARHHEPRAPPRALCKPNVPVVQRSLIGRVSHQNSMCMGSHSLMSLTTTGDAPTTLPVVGGGGPPKSANGVRRR